MQLPVDFIARIQHQFPSDASQFLKALDTEAPVSVRVNPAKDAAVFTEFSSVPWCEHGLYLPQRPIFTLDPLFHAGCYYPQEASSMFLWHVLNALPDLPADPVMLDLCAAPGGKSTLMASFLNGRGVLVANETVRLRANILMENMMKWGYGNILVSQSDPSAFSSVEALFDVVVVDAPCSGEGLFRKDLDARSEWSPENAAMCATRQQNILQHIWDALKPGGYLVYSTCTFNPAENQDNMNWLLKQYDARPVSIAVDDSWGVSPVPVGDGQGWAVYPHQTRGEGFFIAVLQKEGNMHGAVKNKRSEKMVKAKVPQGILKGQDQYFMSTINQTIYALTHVPLMVYSRLASQVRFIHQGIGLGQLVRNDLVPHESLALSLDVVDDYSPIHELSVDEALHFLRGGTQLSVSDVTGWCRVAYHGVPLGWVKAVGNRVNNYYPKEWRIRMGG